MKFEGMKIICLSFEFKAIEHEEDVAIRA